MKIIVVTENKEDYGRYQIKNKEKHRNKGKRHDTEDQERKHTAVKLRSIKQTGRIQ